MHRRSVPVAIVSTKSGGAFRIESHPICFAALYHFLPPNFVGLVCIVSRPREPITDSYTAMSQIGPTQNAVLSDVWMCTSALTVTVLLSSRFCLAGSIDL